MIKIFEQINLFYFNKYNKYELNPTDFFKSINKKYNLYIEIETNDELKLYLFNNTIYDTKYNIKYIIIKNYLIYIELNRVKEIYYFEINNSINYHYLTKDKYYKDFIKNKFITKQYAFYKYKPYKIRIYYFNCNPVYLYDFLLKHKYHISYINNLIYYKHSKRKYKNTSLNFIHNYKVYN